MNPVLKKIQNKYGDYHKDLQKENHNLMSLDHPDNQNDYLDIQCNNRGYNPNIDISNGNNNNNKSVKNNKTIGSKRSRAQLMRQAGQNASNPAAARAATERYMYNKKRKINNGNVQLRFKKRKDDNYSLYDRLKQELLKQYDDGPGCPLHKDKYLEFKDFPGTGWLKMYCIECNNALIGRINHNYVFKENKIKIKMKSEYMTQNELKLQEQTWNSFDPTWKITWSKDRCEQVLRDKKSDMNVIEYAKMYYKHWKSVEYYEKNVFPPLIRENKENYNEWKIKYNELKKQSSKLKEENKTLCKQLTILKKSNEKYKIKMDKMNEYIEENKKLMDKNKELLDENGMCYGRSDKINTLTFGQINELENKLRNGIVSCNQAKEKKVECNICLENRANAYITTCKHCAYCIQCEGKLSDDKRICAICNAPYSKLNVMTINNW